MHPMRLCAIGCGLDVDRCAELQVAVTSDGGRNLRFSFGGPSCVDKLEGPSEFDPVLQDRVSFGPAAIPSRAGLSLFK